MADRPDHMSRMGFGGGAVAPDQDPNAPPVSPHLADYLEGLFPRPAPIVAVRQDDLVSVATAQANQAGREEVIAAIRSLANKPQES